MSASTQNLVELIRNKTGVSVYDAQQTILVAAAKIISDSDDAGLRAIIRTTNPAGALWGAGSMAEEEIIRRAMFGRNDGTAA